MCLSFSHDILTITTLQYIMKSDGIRPPAFVFLVQDGFGYLDFGLLLSFHVNFRVSCYSVKNFTGILIRVKLNL